MTTSTESRPAARSERNQSGFFNPDPSWLPASEVGIPRDDDERPLIVPPCPATKGPEDQHQAEKPCPKCPTEAVPYERVSRVVDAIDNLKWLLRWYQGLLAKGMAMSPDLCGMASALDWNDPRMAAIIETAHDRSGGNEKANWGTAVHSWTEPGRDLASVPEEMRPDVRSYRLAHEEAGVTILRYEVFVVNHTLKVAGTFDTLAECEELGRFLEDKKTGKWSAMANGVQLGTYANSTEVDRDLVKAKLWAPPKALDVNLDWAVVAHIPKGGGTTTLRKVNVRRGYDLAKLAMEVKAHQEMPDWCAPEPLGKVTRKETLAAAIRDATSRPELRDIMLNGERYFTKALTAAAHKRWQELAPS